MGFIKVEKLCKVYNSGQLKFEALKGVDFEVEKGEILSILGPSGCGKSTLLNCLSGIDDPTSGTVTIDGVILHKLGDNKKTAFRAKNMGFIFQFYNLIPVLTVLENVQLAMLSQTRNQKESKEAAKNVLERVGLEDRLNYLPAQLSGGERQRVSIARAIVHKPAIIWADEPTGALDTQTGRKIMELIIDLNKANNQTFVVVTHDERISLYSQRIVFMDSGKIEKIQKNAERENR